LPKVPGRPRAVPSAFIAAVLLVGLVAPAATRAADPPNLKRFMAALGAVESNGRYDAVNSTSGALGKYQILPENWRSWARRYLGDPSAAPTPAHQELVTRRKLTALYGWLDDWGAVAHWWLTGDGERDPGNWSDFSRDYVAKVLACMGRPLLEDAGSAASSLDLPATDGRVAGDSSVAIDYSTGWDTAGFARYSGGHVRYSDTPGASATMTFTGTWIAWIGPVGPTRGKAKVFLDDVLVSTVDLYASHFRARVKVFGETFSGIESHTIRIEVVGTRGRGMVAIDEFVVGR
jgi:hypothetical protein